MRDFKDLQLYKTVIKFKKFVVKYKMFHTHSYKEHFLPDSVSTLRLSLHAELSRTPAGRIIGNVLYL